MLKVRYIFVFAIGALGISMVIFLLSERNQPSAHLIVTPNNSRVSSEGPINVDKDKLVTTRRNNKISAGDGLEKISSNKVDSLEDVELPEVLTEKEINQLLVNLEAKKIWEMQDATIRDWPVYSDVKDQLRKEVASQVDINNLKPEAFVRNAIEFREKFWNAGGLLSKKSWAFAYKSRLLLEIAHDRTPENLEITDELVETIQAACPILVSDTKTGDRIKNEQVGKILLDLRSGQFEQIRSEIANGRTPCPNDLIRVVEFATIGSIYDKEKATIALKWLLSNASRAGWEKYVPQLKDFQYHLNQGGSYYCQLYMYTTQNGHDVALRYGRRYPSFRGPDFEKRGMILWGGNFDDYWELRSED